ncbi:UNVERIFIED_CONTAM: hypothetical protein K2H54_056626 [Gekko kuhli]
MAQGGRRGGGGSQGGAEEQGQALACTRGNLAGRTAAAKAMQSRAGGKGHGNCQPADSLSPPFLASKLQPEEASLLPFFTLSGGTPSTRITPEFSKWASDEMPSTSNGESSKQEPMQKTCKNSDIEKGQHLRASPESKDKSVSKCEVQSDT